MTGAAIGEQMALDDAIDDMLAASDFYRWLMSRKEANDRLTKHDLRSEKRAQKRKQKQERKQNDGAVS
mgnify:CR=1 FL=1